MSLRPKFKLVKVKDNLPGFHKLVKDTSKIQTLLPTKTYHHRKIISNFRLPQHYHNKLKHHPN